MATVSPRSPVMDPKLTRDQELLLNKIYRRVHEAEKFEDILWELEQDMLALLQAERLTIYKRDPNGADIVSWFHTGEDTVEIREPLSTTSVAGFVALTHQPVRINNVYDDAELKAVDEHLEFDSSYDQQSGFVTQSMVVVPIKFKSTLLGVLQVINRLDGGVFNDDDVIHCLAVANVVAQKFRYDMKSTSGPFEFLVKSGRITADNLMAMEAMAENKGVSLHRLLMRDAKIKPEEISASLEQFYQVPCLDFDPAVLPDEETINRLDRAFLGRNRWCPFRGANGEMIILIDDPNDADRLMQIQHLCNASSYELRVGLPENILRYLGYDVPADMNDVDLGSLVVKLKSERDADVAKGSDTKTELKDAEGEELLDENDSTIINLVNRLIVEAVDSRASDIHIEPFKGNAPAQVRMRADGVCHKTLEIPASHVRAVVARIKILAKLDIAERRKPQDGKMGVKLRGQPIELRVATLPTVCGESAVLRILAAGEAMPIDKLNLSPSNNTTLLRLLEKPHGIFLVVGPTGSGKTTTLHAVLGYMNTEDVKILTAEDPVEITQNGLQQVQVAPRIGYTFAMALRAFLRCDPDIILIGEMRDLETAHAGLEASLTGHLVFSTLHTNSAPETVVRLLDMGLDPLNFADAIIGVLAQRLVRTLCKKCKEPYTPSEEELALLVRAYGGPELAQELLNVKQNFHRAKEGGCEDCKGSGYRGRTGMHELLEATPRMKEMISKRDNVTNIRIQAVKDGLRSLRQDGILKIFKGDTDWNQVKGITVE